MGDEKTIPRIVFVCHTTYSVIGKLPGSVGVCWLRPFDTPYQATQDAESAGKTHAE